MIFNISNYFKYKLFFIILTYTKRKNLLTKTKTEITKTKN
jgi:hypothetical protein